MYVQTAFLPRRHVSERVCAHESVCANMSKIEGWGDCKNREIDTANVTNGGGTKAERSEKKDRGGGEKRLDIWLLEFNKTLKERKRR